MTLKKLTSALHPAKPHEKSDENTVIDQQYHCELKEKGQEENTTWVMLTNDKEQIYGYCDFPWKFQGDVTVSGNREETDGRKYITITKIHPFEAHKPKK